MNKNMMNSQKINKYQIENLMDMLKGKGIELYEGGFIYYTEANADRIEMAIQNLLK